MKPGLAPSTVLTITLGNCTYTYNHNDNHTVSMLAPMLDIVNNISQECRS